MAKTASQMASLGEKNAQSKSELQAAASQDRQEREAYGDDYRERGGYTDDGNQKLIGFQNSDDPERYLDDLARRAGASDETNGLQRLLTAADINGRAKVMSEPDFERFVRMSGATVMYRGWRGKEDYDRFLQSGKTDVTANNYSDGFLVARNVESARAMAGSGNTITRMVLNPNARVISYERVSREVRNSGSRLSESQMALKMGYNVIRVSNGNYVGLTRDAFIISRKSIRY